MTQPIPPSPFKILLWGISIALSWTWGLGLFFSVQIAIHFGLAGLLLFAIPNALGLMGFGFFTGRIARRHQTARDFERYFFRTSYSLRYVILAYQLVAVTLTFFAIFRYLFLPLEVNLALGVLIVLGAALILGEQFDISQIKFSHAVMFAGILLAMVGIAVGLVNFLAQAGLPVIVAGGHESVLQWGFLGYLVPIVAGFLVGPWLDVQQWHRAVQIHREGLNIRSAYLIGGILFFGILLFHGLVALVAFGAGGMALVPPSFDGLFHAKDAVVRLIFPESSLFLQISYLAFIFLCIISTLDSGYVSLRWYMREVVRRSESILLTVVPASAVSSPVLPMVVAVCIGAVSVPLHFELEYFMSFYGSFSIGYAIVLLFRTAYLPEFTSFTQTVLFSVAAFSLGLFGVGYFEEMWPLMALGALTPLVHGMVTISGRVVVDDLQKAFPRQTDSTDDVPMESVSGRAAERAIAALQSAISHIDPKTGDRFKEAFQKIEPAAAQALASLLSSVNPAHAEGTPGTSIVGLDDTFADDHARGHFEGNWFCHTFMMTYSDTNSVGNVYFANYIVFVGKVREMFFRTAMPEFDLKKTGFYILTRQIEHKFQIEAKEFDLLTVRIRVAGFNRKFATLEHQIVNQAREILGHGRQILMFVSSQDYRLVDLPNELKTAFLPYTGAGGGEARDSAVG